MPAWGSIGTKLLAVPVLPSALPNLSGMPLADLNAAVIDEAVKRVIPETLEPSDTPFNSAI